MKTETFGDYVLQQNEDGSTTGFAKLSPIFTCDSMLPETNWQFAVIIVSTLNIAGITPEQFKSARKINLPPLELAYPIAAILRAWLELMSKSTETFATPKFKIGDKVRVNGEIGENDYSEGQYDTIIEVGSGYKYAVRYADGGVESSLAWDENELLPYIEETQD